MAVLHNNGTYMRRLISCTVQEERAQCQLPRDATSKRDFGLRHHTQLADRCLSTSYEPGPDLQLSPEIASPDWSTKPHHPATHHHHIPTYSHRDA